MCACKVEWLSGCGDEMGLISSMDPSPLSPSDTPHAAAMGKSVKGIDAVF